LIDWTNVRIALGRLKRRRHDPDADIGQGLAERRAPFGISIADQDPVAPEDTVIRAGQHTSDLEHEGVIRMRRRSHQMHASRLQLDDKERVVRDQTADGPQLGGKEIRRGDRAPVGGQKRAPGHRPLRNGANPVGLQDRGDRGSGDAMPEVRQGTLDPAVAPRRILTRHPDGQLADLAKHARSSDASSLSGPFTGDELPMPSQDGVRRDQRRHLTQDVSSEAVPVHGEPTSLGIGQPQAPSVKVLFQDAVLFSQVLDDLELVAIHQPASATRTIRSWTASIMDRVYLSGPPLHPIEHSAEFSVSAARAYATGRKASIDALLKDIDSVV
jgi:hypothetical protein